MKTVYLVWYTWSRYSYGRLRESCNLKGMFKNIENVKVYILKQPYCLSDYEIEEFDGFHE